MKYNNILIAPDSFKGGVSSVRFCEIVSEKIKKLRPEAVVRSLPIADGGEGTLECLKISAGGKSVFADTVGPYGEPMKAEILFTKVNEAVIETASCAGLPLVYGRMDPEKTTTAGLGKLIEYAVGHGAEHIILTLGGSCTNDCGAGMLSGMGIVFRDADGKRFVPTGGTLGRVKTVEKSAEFAKYADISFTAMCDVRNPLYGDNGCTHIFARQKGADDAMIGRLEACVKSFSAAVSEALGQDFSQDEGTGAAGGLGFACRAFLDGELKSGIETVLDLCGFDRLAETADLVITGEGWFDYQSLMGKVIGGIVAHSGSVPVAVLSGKYRQFDTSGFPNLKYIIPVSEGQELDYAIAHEPENLRRGTEKLFSIIEKEGY